MYSQEDKSKESKTNINKVVQKKHAGQTGRSLEDNRTAKGTSQLMSKGTIQRWPPKDWYAPGPGKGFIPFMGAQYDPKFRDPKHEELLKGIPKSQSPLKTFVQENAYASKFPFQGSKSMLGDSGILAHKAFAMASRHKGLALPVLGGLATFGAYQHFQGKKQ